MRTPKHELQDPLALFSFPQTLWKHQHEDVEEGFLTGPWGEWASVGTGKTCMCLAAYKVLRDEGKLDGLLVLGPESASHAWVGECSDAATWGMESALVTDKVKKKGLPAEPILFCNYDKAWREPYSSRLLAKIKNGRVALVMDEAHMALGRTSRRFGCVELWARLCPYRWLLTGTPVSNYPDKLWGIWRMLTGDHTTYEEWCLWFQRDDKTYHTERLRQLGRYMQRFSRVRTRKEVSPHLPETTVRTIPVRLVGVQRERYARLLEDLEGAEGNDWLGGLQRLLGVCSHPDLIRSGEPLAGNESKLATLLEVLEGCEGSKVVVWSWHPGTLDWLKKKLPWESVVYHGGTSEAFRARAVARFNQDPACRLFLGNPSAAGAGLNLPQGQGSVFWDASYKAVQHAQARGRIERGMEYSPKFEIRLVAQGTVEMACWDAITKKVDLAGLVLSPGRPLEKRAHTASIAALWAKG